MATRMLALALLAPALALSACGGTKNVDTAKYTCAQWNKSLATKGDDTAGNFINQLRKQAQLGQGAKTERNEISLGVYAACQGKPGSTRPAQAAVAAAKQIKAGKFHLERAAKGKKSGK